MASNTKDAYNRSYNRQLLTIIMSLKKTLEESGTATKEKPKIDA